MANIGDLPGLGGGAGFSPIGDDDFKVTPPGSDKGLDTGSTVTNAGGAGGGAGGADFDPSNPPIGQPDAPQGPGGVYSGNKWLTGVDSATMIFNMILELGPEMRDMIMQEVETKLQMMVAKAENARETAEIQLASSELQAQMYEADAVRAWTQIAGAITSLTISVASTATIATMKGVASSKFKSQQQAHENWDPKSGTPQPKAPSEEAFRTKMETFTMVSQTITQTSQSISQIISSGGEIWTANQKGALERIKGELDALKTMLDNLGQTLASTAQASAQDLQEMIQHADRLSKILDDAIRTAQGVWNPGRQY